MSARRRTKGQDVAKPPKLKQLVNESGDSEIEARETDVTEAEPAAQRKGGITSTLCGCLKYVLLLLIVPPFLNYAALQRETTELQPPDGELYDVGWGRKMYLMCSGKGPPTVILDAPTGVTSDVWSLVWPKVHKHARVCVYDRAGLGFSERSSPPNVTTPTANTDNIDNGPEFTQHARGQPFTVESMTDDLHRLVTSSSQQPSPFILVGAELGALVSQFFTLLFDRNVLGVVLINPLPETLFDNDDKHTWSHYWYGQLVPTYQSLQLSAAVGVSRLGVLTGVLKQPLPSSHLNQSVVNRQNHLMCHPKHMSSVVDEHHFINDTFSQMRTLRMLRAFPSNVSVTVMTGNYYDEQLPSSLNKAWARAQQALISRAFPSAQQIVVNGADRHMALTHPEAVVEQVLRMVRRWKVRQPPASHQS